MEAGGNGWGENIAIGENYGGGSGAAFNGTVELKKGEQYEYKIGRGRK